MNRININIKGCTAASIRILLIRSSCNGMRSGRLCETESDTKSKESYSIGADNLIRALSGYQQGE